MITWINGPFGVGKSTVADMLAAEWPGAIVFDPEYLGFVLRAWWPPDIEVDDYQHLSVWRRLVREAAAGLLRDFGRPLVVPMTLLNPAYFDEIVGGLRADGVEVRHFCLTATREEVLARVDARGDATEWFPRKYDEYAPHLFDPRFATHVATSGRSPDAVLAEVLGSLPSPLPGSAYI
ncbi:MAG TPA: AAA family ATPase [Acidimicrobiia bacterium]|nr:AAA family ATPase [Acidimicrobiia bacterium]